MSYSGQRIDELTSENAQALAAVATANGAAKDDVSNVSNDDFYGKGVAAGLASAVAVSTGLVSVKTFGAVGNGSTDDTAALQDAIDSGYGLLFPAGTYPCSGLTQSTNGQKFYGEGDVRLVKNANGDLITFDGDNVECQNIQFRGDASTPVYTGHNVVATGDHFHLINCGSRWAYARAVKATGHAVHIHGTNDIYQTADATASGWDIEIGVSGTATLYHQIFGLYTSQATGGVLLVDTGGHVILGGQFGKLTIDSGTGPAGSNGGMTSGARILGDVTVELPSATFVGNQFGDVVVTLASGTSGIRLDQSNTYSSSATVTNSGNANNLIVRQVSGGSKVTLRYGADASYVDVDYIQGDKVRYPEGLKVANAKNLVIENAAGGDGMSTQVNSSGDLFVTTWTSNRGTVHSTVGASSYWRVDHNGTTRFRVDATGIQVTGKVLASAGLGVGNSAAGSSLGTVTNKMEVFDGAGASLGFVPIYDAIT